MQHTKPKNSGRSSSKRGESPRATPTALSLTSLLLVFVVLLSSAPASAQSVAPEPEPAPVPAPSLEEEWDWSDRLVTMGSVGAVYAAVGTWSYFAWYKQRTTTEELQFKDEGWFGVDTYAGGSDKLGHMFSNYTMNRLATGILMAGGWEPWVSSLVSSGLTMGFFTGIELKDGYHRGFGFSWGDMVFNTMGNVLAGLMVNVPALDEMFDFRLEYVPTDEYIQLLQERGVVNAAEDYSGQTFKVAYHLDSIPAVKNRDSLDWFRYFDVVVGYQAVNYLPEPSDPNAVRRQELFVGLSLNMRQLLSDSLYPRLEGSSSINVVRPALNGVTEVFSVPYTTLRVAEAGRDGSSAYSREAFPSP